MHLFGRRVISLKTGSNGLEYGLVVALAAVAVVIGIARFDPMRPVDHQLLPKFHSQTDHVS